MSDRKQLYKKRKQKCLDLNICYKCLKPKNDNKLQCDKCLEEHRRKNKELRLCRATINLCNCGKLSLSNKRLCACCAEKHRTTQINLRTEYKQNNNCTTCGQQRKPGLLTCAKCINRATNATLRRYNSNKKNNVCISCGGESKNKFRCETCNQNNLKRNKLHRQRQRLIVIEHYGRICICCGENTYEFLEIDHIYNNGAQHRKITGRHVERWIIKNKFPSDLQLLCANCNRGHGKFNICPHKQEPSLPKSRHAQNGRKQRLRCIKHYGGKCQCCGESNWAFLEFDHIDRDGKQHRKTIKSSNMSGWLIRNNFPNNIQLLCSNCNKAKGLYETCPHQGSKLPYRRK